MLGPGVAWYFAVGGAVFAIGTAGVMLRRNPLIMLLALELMLNGGNLVLIASARLHGSLDGQVFALAVMAIAAAEVVVGLGLVVAMVRREIEIDVDRLSRLRK